MKGYIVERCPHCNAYLRQRNTDQNAKFHAMVSGLAESRKWAGEYISPEDWKRLLIAAWERTQGRAPRMLPALDGSGFDVVYRRSSRLSKEEMSDLIEFAQAFMVKEEA